MLFIHESGDAAVDSIANLGYRSGGDMASAECGVNERTVKNVFPCLCLVGDISSLFVLFETC